ncbi:MAG: hypothetical protein LBL13_00495 [Bacteroidales bacterium]|jgi:hypothetical protein|nr:hypothetical protein [Bacteroidales bacterium]
MKLSKLIKQHAWADIAPEFVKQYPQRAHLLDTYGKLYGVCQHMTPVRTDISIYIYPIRTEEMHNDWRGEYDGYPYRYPEVPGRRKHLDIDEGSLSSSRMGLITWEEWLGMDITQEAWQTFSPVEIICHCLRTMTSYGYTQETIQDIKAMIKDEAAYYFIDKAIAEKTVNTDFLSLSLESSEVLTSEQTDFRHATLFHIKRFFRKTTLKYLIRKYIRRKYISSADIWGLHTHLAPFIIWCLTNFLNYNRHGTIGGIMPDEVGTGAVEVWDDVLKEMIFSFEFLLRKNDRRFIKKHFAANNYTAELEAEARKRVQQGFELFGIYYTDLWD